jgi:hypothetical protein
MLTYHIIKMSVEIANHQCLVVKTELYGDFVNNLPHAIKIQWSLARQ